MGGESSEVGNQEKRGAVTTKNGCREEGQGTRRTESQKLIHEGDKNARQQFTMSIVRPTAAGQAKSSREALGRKEGGEGELALAELSRHHRVDNRAVEGRHSQGEGESVLSSIREREREEGVTPPLSPETRNKIREIVENILGLLPMK